MNEITIFLPEKEAELFVLFQKHYEVFKLLEERGVFNQKNSAITLHFDSNGVLQVINRADFLYSRKHDLTNTL